MGLTSETFEKQTTHIKSQTRKLQFITQNHHIILENHDRFQQEATVYEENMCGKLTKHRGIEEKDLQPKLEFFKSLGPTAFEIAWVEEFLEKHSRARCCLPKGHAGDCVHKLDARVPKVFKTKIAACIQLEGNQKNNTGSPFLNRQSRFCPIQLLRTAKVDLGGVAESFAIPIEGGSTGFLTATCYFDWAALITLQKGFEVNEFYQEHLDQYRKHAEFLTHYYKSVHRIRIVNDEGYLCDPLTFKTLEPEWWTQGHIIQFGHVLPKCDTEYRTRGLNTVPMTRVSNITQGDRPFSQAVEELIVIAEIHKKLYQ